MLAAYCCFFESSLVTASPRMRTQNAKMPGEYVSFMVDDPSYSDKSGSMYPVPAGSDRSNR